MEKGTNVVSIANKNTNICPTDSKIIATIISSLLRSRGSNSELIFRVKKVINNSNLQAYTTLLFQAKREVDDGLTWIRLDFDEGQSGTVFFFFTDADNFISTSFQYKYTDASSVTEDILSIILTDADLSIMTIDK